jgi:hypothetical protein
MYQLYKTHDLSLLMEKNLFPFLTRKICNYNHSWGDINSLRCVDTGLNALIKDPMPKCKKIKVGNKTVCSIHCRSLPIYQYLQNHLEKHDMDETQGGAFIHFRRKSLADMFAIQYSHRIKRRGKNRNGAVRSCCGGKGFLLTMEAEKKYQIMKAKWVKVKYTMTDL